MPSLATKFFFLLCVGFVTAQHAPMVHLTDATFAETVVVGVNSSHTDYFVLFYAPWCGHCKAIKPLFEDANAAVASLEAQENAAKKVSRERVAARFAMVDAVANPMLSKAYRIKSFPTFYYFIGGHAYKYDGVRDTEAFSYFARYLGAGRQLGTFAPTIGKASHVYELQSQAPSRVLSLLSRECLDESSSLRPTCRELIHSTLGNGKLHFAVLSADPEIFFSAPDELQQRWITAFNSASPGPNGEKLITLSSLFRDDDAVPFKGTWSLDHQTDLKAAIAHGTFDAANPDVADEIQNLWNFVLKSPVEAVSFVSQHSAFPVDNGDSAGIRSAMDQDGGKGFLAFLLVGEEPSMQTEGVKILRSIAQRRNALRLEVAELPSRPRAVGFFSTRAAPDLMSQLAVPSIPGFALYHPKSELTCVLDVSPEIFTDETARAEFQRSLNELLAAIDGGSMTHCSATTLTGKIARLTTWFLPSIDQLLRESYNLGNLEIVMLEAVAVIFIAIIPLAMCRSPSAEDRMDELEEIRRLRLKAKPKAE